MYHEGLVHDLPTGDYAEVGVFQGDGAVRIAAAMNPKSTLWLFDSFQGHAEPHPCDDGAAHPKGRYSNTSMDQVADRFLNVRRDVRIIPGYIPTTFRVIENCKFRFVRIDVDHYVPTLDACQFFKPRMVSGGIIEFDDYRVQECPGATKSVDDIFGRDTISPESPYFWTAP